MKNCLVCCALLLWAAQPLAAGDRANPLDLDLFTPGAPGYQPDRLLVGVEGQIGQAGPITDVILYPPQSAVGGTRVGLNLQDITLGDPDVPSAFQNIHVSAVFSNTPSAQSVGLRIGHQANITGDRTDLERDALVFTAFNAPLLVHSESPGPVELVLQVHQDTTGIVEGNSDGNSFMFFELLDPSGGDLRALGGDGGFLAYASGGFESFGAYEGLVGHVDPDTGRFNVAGRGGPITITLPISDTTVPRRVVFNGNLDLQALASGLGSIVISNTNSTLLTVSTTTPGVTLSFIPEPASLAMLAVAAWGLVTLYRRRGLR